MTDPQTHGGSAGESAIGDAPHEPRHKAGQGLTLLALGVVFGDIGTSPLYAVRECFSGDHGLAVDGAGVLGVLSLIFWSLVVVVTVKYLHYVMRADHQGEGGVLALMTLAMPHHNGGRRRAAIVAMGVVGAALLYADGMISPSIAVLSAVEGLQVAGGWPSYAVVLAAIVILVLLFSFQSRGTGGVGAVFGPVMVVWFSTLAVLGIRWIVIHPQVLHALDPLHGLRLLATHGFHGFLVLGSVFLAVTGTESLYADLGHFGRPPIRRAWLRIAFPGLVLNYFGQGALLLHDPQAAVNPFYRLVPSWGLYPLLGLATAATVIASQAVISGAFSLTRQAVQLGLAPRLEIRHSSAQEIGQVYVPWINGALMVATVTLVIGFGSSSKLAGAYGVAVASTMVLTTLLAHVCARRRWGWPWWKAALITVPLLAIDLAFLGANSFKIGAGGWLPLAVAAFLYLLMRTWERGRLFLGGRLAGARVADELFLASLGREGLTRVPGTAVFLDRYGSGMPRSLLHNIKHNRVIHEHVVLLTVVWEQRPRVPPAERIGVAELGSGFLRVRARYGFMETPDLQQVLENLRGEKRIPAGQASFFLARESLVLTAQPGMPGWRKRLFAFLARNAQPVTAHFHIPPSRVMELGEQVEL
jgi:KUP system potassium uptake protein